MTRGFNTETVGFFGEEDTLDGDISTVGFFGDGWAELDVELTEESDSSTAHHFGDGWAELTEESDSSTARFFGDRQAELDEELDTNNGLIFLLPSSLDLADNFISIFFIFSWSSLIGSTSSLKKGACFRVS